MISFTIIIQLMVWISPEEATFTKENDRAKITIVVQNVGIEKSIGQNNNAYYLFLFRLSKMIQKQIAFDVNKRNKNVSFVLLC